MATITPDEGLEWFVSLGFDESSVADEKFYEVAIGTGTASLSSADTQLDQEVYRADSDDSNVSIENTSSFGDVEVKITVSGGTEIPAESDITEIGVFARDPSIPDGDVTDADDTMVYRELRSAVTVSSGDTKTFAFTISVTN